MGRLSKWLRKDAAARVLGAELDADLDPRAIVHYGLPAYKDYQMRREPRLARKLRKFAARPARRRLEQQRDYIRLGDFREMETWVFLDEYWRAGLDWRATARGRDFAARIAAGETVKLHSKRRFLSCEADLEPYFAEYAQLLSSMAERGYLATGARDRITIMLDRDGGILKETKGRHRLAAAQVVGTPSVPVRVSHVHSAWVDAQAASSPPGTPRVELVRLAIRAALAPHRAPR